MRECAGYCDELHIYPAWHVVKPDCVTRWCGWSFAIMTEEQVYLRRVCRLGLEGGALVSPLPVFDAEFPLPTVS